MNIKAQFHKEKTHSNHERKLKADLERVQKNQSKNKRGVNPSHLIKIKM